MRRFARRSLKSYAAPFLRRHTTRRLCVRQTAADARCVLRVPPEARF